MNANAAMVEYKQWEGLEKGKERMIRDGQNVKLIEQCGVNEIKVSDQLVRATNAKNSVIDKITYDRGYAERLVTQKKENEVLHKKTLEYKQGMHSKQKEFEENLREIEQKRKPFNAKINEMSMANATAQKQKRMGGGQGDNTMEYLIEEQEGAYDFESHHSGFDMGMDDQQQDDIEAKMAQEAM